MRREAFYALVIGLFFGAFFYLLIENLHVFGRYIPSPDIMIDYMKGFFWAVVCFMMTFFIPAKPNERVSIMILWGLRCVVTLGFMLYYEYSYGLDAYSYFNSALKNDFGHYKTFDLTNGTYMVMQFTRFIVQYIPFMDSYHALKVFWSFLGFVGSYFFYLAYTKYIGRTNIYLLWILLAFPSILFWSSILGKDPLTYFGIALFFYGSLSLLSRFEIWAFIPTSIGLLILMCIRTWLLPLFILPFALIYFLRSKANIAYKYALLTALLIPVVSNTSNILNNINIANTAEVFTTLNSVSQSWSRGGSAQKISDLSSPTKFAAFLPLGMFTALFRPLPGEINNVFGILSGLENALILIALIIAFTYRKSFLFHDLFIQYGIAILVFWSIFYSFISYQNLGAAVRFKLQVIPLLILIPAHVWWLNKRKKLSTEEN